MNSKRIIALASLVKREDTVLDVGCDHGYLSIYLKLNNLCKNVLAGDISESALNSAIRNFKKYNVLINAYVSDGFKDVEEYFDTAVISGMGATTIINIINKKRIPKLIISSNNDYHKLRLTLNKLNYKLEKEIVVLENNHYYPIMLYKEGSQKLSNKELKYGISKDNEYYDYLISKNKEIIKKVPLLKKIKLIKENMIIKTLI